jgi:ribosome maturation protein Sdo1
MGKDCLEIATRRARQRLDQFEAVETQANGVLKTLSRLSPLQ